MIARGLGRCYGDAALADNIVSTTAFHHFLAFDKEKGLLTCQAGVSLAEILEVIVPYGWFLPVVPGTKNVTVGGAIASDVHGKNHSSQGSFSRHITELKLLTANGTIASCSATVLPALYWGTCGGMGLTGIILSATIRLMKIETGFFRQTSLKTKDLDGTFKAFEDNAKFPYSVTWTDGLAKGKHLGRSLLHVGEHAGLGDLKSHQQPYLIKQAGTKQIPFNLPEIVMGPLAIKMFNYLYYNKAALSKTRVLPYESFFFPLDKIGGWSKIYGRRGFVQYQFVLPSQAAYEGMKQVLEKVANHREGSFPSVLKKFGAQDNIISFPMEGYCLAMDFPAKETIFKLMNELDEIVVKHGGRIYLTKDARMSPAVFKAGYKFLDAFKRIKKEVDPTGKFESLLSKRLEI